LFLLLAVLGDFLDSPPDEFGDLFVGCASYFDPAPPEKSSLQVSLSETRGTETIAE
jgi:hypothetical protein